jgi:hypothetical protein
VVLNSGLGMANNSLWPVPLPACGDFRGYCLDPSYELRGITMPVSCKCLNDTCCALCGEPFNEHQLDSYYSDLDSNRWSTSQHT